MCSLLPSMHECAVHRHMPAATLPASAAAKVGTWPIGTRYGVCKVLMSEFLDSNVLNKIVLKQRCTFNHILKVAAVVTL